MCNLLNVTMFSMFSMTESRQERVRRSVRGRRVPAVSDPCSHERHRPQTHRTE